MVLIKFGKIDVKTVTLIFKPCHDNVSLFEMYTSAKISNVDVICYFGNKDFEMCVKERESDRESERERESE